MVDKFRELAAHLCCPDDEGDLRVDSDALACMRCGRIYPLHGGQVLELLPSRPAETMLGKNREYASDYERAFLEPFTFRENAMAWGAAELSEPAWLAKRQRQVRAVVSSLADGDAGAHPFLCDISAGGGHYTFALARHFKWVLHCDLSVDALSYAVRKSAQLGLSNIFFLRVDYFRLPFAHSIDRLVCLDTLIRGKHHELAVLPQIRKTLGPGGKALIDFHNWWHNPLRRIGLLPQNFGNNRSYSRSEAESLLLDCGIDRWRFIHFCQEFDPASQMHGALSQWIPPARLMFEFSAPRQEGRRFDSAD